MYSGFFKAAYYSILYVNTPADQNEKNEHMDWLRWNNLVILEKLEEAHNEKI